MLDVSMPRMTGLQARPSSSSAAPELRMLMLSMHDNEQYLFEALKAGASGYVLKTRRRPRPRRGLRAAVRGEPFLYPAAVAALIRDYLERAQPGEATPTDPLTPRELEIVKLVAEGHTTDEIASSPRDQQEAPSSATAANILEKLGMRDRVELDALRDPARARRAVSALRVGLLSTARINDSLLEGAAATDAAEVVAVASRTEARAAAYAHERGIPRAHGSYEALLADPEVDAVYVALPNALHAPWSIRALEAGKHVLCEKPLARTAAAAERAFAAADRAGRVLMEAFMWRHLPQTRTLVELVRDGAIGRLRLVRSAFTFVLDRPEDFRTGPEHEGGALMDVGCYCVSAIRLLAGEPQRAQAEQVLGGRSRRRPRRRPPPARRRGRRVRLRLRHALAGDLEVVGEDGILVVPDPWFARGAPLALRRGDDVETIASERANPYQLELENLAAAAAGTAPPLLGRADAVGQARAIELLYASAA